MSHTARLHTRPREITQRGTVGDRSIILGLFLFSGVSGLVYEVVWSRMFVLVLGSTVSAVSTVLAVFMGGLALGSWLFGRFADRPRANGLRMYAWLEIGVGGFAIALPGLIGLSNTVYQWAWPAVADSFGTLMALRVLLATMILIIPATLMGGTLPVLSRFLVRTRERTGREIGTLYAINTLGAVAGCFVAGFFLLEYLGVQRSLLLAAGLNFAVGGTALLRSRGVELPLAKRKAEPAPENTRHYSRSQVRLALVLYAFSGLAALALEVLWTRSLMYFTSVDTYAFTAMLSAFLCGIGLGSLLMAPLVGRIRHPLLVLGVIELLIGLSAALSIPLFAKLHTATATIAATVPAATLLGKIITKLFASFFIMLVPTLLMGAAFPLFSTIYVGARRQIGRGIGALYALNTVGAIVGAAAAGFWIIPTFGLQRGIILCASLYALLGLLLLAATPRERERRVVVAGVAAVGLALLVVLNLRVPDTPFIVHSAFFKTPSQKHRLVFSHEGSAASLTVLKNGAGTKLLNINGITTAINNHMDMQVHRMLSHLPLLLHPDPQTVLVVGFGMGSTPWGCCQHDVQRVDVVELLRSETRTARIFADVNHGVLHHPKLNFIVGDGRNYLLAAPVRYDMISFNAIHPRYSAYLYTKDFYELCRKRMTDDGVVCAWMTQNSMLDDEFRMLCRSFVEVFPHASLWYCNPQHFCLIGTLKPTRIDLDAWRQRMAVDNVQRDLADSDLDDPFVLLARYMMGGESLAKYVAGAPLNTDDQPRIEFTRSSKHQERAIIERLIASRESVAPLLDAGNDDDWTHQRLARYEEAAGWLMIGQVEHWYPRSGHTLKPEIAFRRALLACPENRDIRHNLVFSRTVRQKVVQALQANPNHVGALTRYGTILMEEGQTDQAEALLSHALQIQGGFVPAREQLGLVRLFCGNPDGSVPWLRSALATRPDDPRLQYALSVALDRTGQGDEAVSLREAALASNPDLAEWFTLREQSVQRMRQFSRTTVVGR